MKFLLVALVGLAPFVLSACAIHIDSGSWGGGTAMQGSGKRVAETRAVSAFHAIAFGGAGSLDVRVGQQQKVVLEIDDNLLPEITTEVRDGVLHIGGKRRYRSEKGLHVTIQVPELDSMDLSGSGAARVEGVKGSKFRADISGSGRLAASGAVDSLALDISGSGRADLASLRVRDAAVDISGSGSVKVDARESLKADISGSGSIAYAGNPSRVEKSISGSGSVRPDQ
jgi:hypothetical protein